MPLASCNRDTSAPAVRADRLPLTPVTVEVRDDGLAYLPGAPTPFTGEAITPHPDTPWLVKLKEPYMDGKRHGEKLEYFKNGQVKHLRRYNMGVPEYGASYHRNGQMKVEIHLNAQDKAEGPYQRWYEDGTLEAAASFDELERWHGDFKEWDREGKPKSHYQFKNGEMQKIIFETEESKKARLEKGMEPANP